MATVDAKLLTLLELAKRSNKGSILAIAETLNRTNEILTDAVYVPANGQTSHVTTRRLHLPTGSWRKINQGVARESSRTEQVVENIGMLEAISQVDQALVDLAEDSGTFRMTEDLAFVEGMSQTLATALIYGNTAGAPEQIDGLATRFNALTSASTSPVHNVHSADGSGQDLTSLWVVQWGPDKVHLVYPKSSASGGIVHQDDGLVTVYDSAGNPYKVYQSHFKVHVGLVVRDARCVQRICNIESGGTSNTFDPDLLIEALREMPQGGASAVIYANRTVLAQMDKDAAGKTNVQYGANDPWGRPTMSFRGVQVRQVDAILNTETAVS